MIICTYVLHIYHRERITSFAFTVIYYHLPKMMSNVLMRVVSHVITGPTIYIHLSVCPWGKQQNNEYKCHSWFSATGFYWQQKQKRSELKIK